MLIRLFQLTARSSVAGCLVRPFPRLFASFSFSSPTKRPAKSTWALALVRGLQVPPMRARSRLRAGGTKTLAVRRLSSPSLPDIGDNPSQYEDPADPLVLGGLPDDDRQARRLGVASPAPAWSSALRNRLDDTAQAPASDGECGARAASRRGRNRRRLGWRHPGRDPREPPAQGAPRGTRRGSR